MIKIDSIVKEALADKGYDTFHLYGRYLMWAIRCLRELNIDHTEDIKTVAYPEDYITYNKIGVKIGDRLHAFVRDNTITTHHTDRYTANKAFYNEALTQLQSLRFNNYYERSSGTSSGFYNYVDFEGYAHNGVGYFKPNDKCKEFQLSSDINVREVLLEYVYDNYNPDTETFVTPQLREVIRQYIHFQDAEFRDGSPLAMKRDKELDFLNALSDYDKRISDISYQGILDSLRINTTMNIKG